MNSLFGLNLRAIENNLENFDLKKLSNIHKKRQADNMDIDTPVKFVFQPPLPIARQISDFQKLRAGKNRWNGQIAFVGFKGEFKYEYWSLIEEDLRVISGLSKIAFIDTKLSSDHLRYLVYLMNWIQPENLTLVFKQNEIDDVAMDEFLIQNLIPVYGRKIRSVIVSSNPGIYKGEFVGKLKYTLEQLTKNDPLYEYLFLQNEYQKSLAFLKIVEKNPPPDLSAMVAKIYKKLDQSFLYKMSLRNCFSKENWRSFQYLIESAYNVEKLEQIESMEIGGCYLGNENQFERLCGRLSTSKGLLALGLSGVKELKDPYVIQRLKGNRYDKIRLNEIDIGENEDIGEKAFEILSQSLLTTVKHFKTDGSLGSHLPVLVKVLFLCEAQALVNRQLMQKSIQENYLFRSNLQSLDLGKVDNYNRSDLCELLLKNFIFNEFSDVREFTWQNLDVGRAEAYANALTTFEKYIQAKKQTNPQLYKDFKPKLKTIKKGYQGYRMEDEPISEIYRRYFFSTNNELLNIEEFHLISAFSYSVSAMESGLILASKKLKELLDKDASIHPTVKRIYLENNSCTNSDLYDQFFNTIIWSKQSKVELISIVGQQLFNQSLFETGTNFLANVESHPLQIICIQDCHESTIDVYQFLENFIYTKKLRLKEIKITNLQNTSDTEREAQVEEIILKHQTNLTLEKVTIGHFEYSPLGSEDFLFKHLILNPKSQITDLTLRRFDIQDFTNLHEYYEQQVLSGYKPLEQLKNLTFYEWQDYSVDQWTMISKFLIFGKYQRLYHIGFETFTMNADVINGLVQGSNKLLQTFDSPDYEPLIMDDGGLDQTQNPSNKRRVKQPINISSSDILFIRSLRFEKCQFDFDQISPFLVSPSCFLEKLSIVNCTGLNTVVTQIKDKVAKDESLLSGFTMSILELNLEGSILSETDLFRWFMENIVFKRSRQRLKILNLKDCYITDEHMIIINEIFQELKDYEEKEMLKNYFRLREIQMDRNTGINFKQWKNLFGHLLTVYSGAGNDDDYEEAQEKLELEKAEKLTKMNEQKDSVGEQTAKLLQKSRLSIPEKLLSNPKEFQQQVPVELKNVNIHMQYEGDDVSIAKTVQRIIRGMIFFSNSSIEQLTINQLDMQNFIPAVEQALYLQNKLVNGNLTQFYSRLKEFKIEGVQKDTYETLQAFFDIFLRGGQFNLTKFSIDSFSNEQFTSMLLQTLSKSLNQGIKLNLKILELTNLSGSFEKEQTLQLFKEIIFNNKLPLESFTIGPSFILQAQDDFHDQIKNHLIQQNYTCPLKRFKIWTENSTEVYNLVVKISPLLFEGVLVKLEYLNITANENYTKYNILQNVNEQMLQNFTIKDLTFDFRFDLDLKHFQFFQAIRSKLTSLNVTKIDLDPQAEVEVQLFLDEKVSTNQSNKFPPAKLSLAFSDQCGSIEWILKNFAFGPQFQWEYITFTTVRCFDYLMNVPLSTPSYQRTLKYLNFTFGLVYTSYEQLSPEGLENIARHLIYNEKSVLEALILHGCHLKFPALEALTKPAKEFRKKVEDQNLQKTMLLSLKRICIYYALYITDEGVELLNKDLAFFEYINLERYEAEVTNYNSANAISLCKAANEWMEFQKKHQRRQLLIPIKHLDIGRNEFVSTKEAWDNLCDTFIFSDNTPNLEVLKIHFMAFTDQKVKFLIQKAQEFFRWKTWRYVHPLRKLDFSLNTALSAKGWGKITRDVFFPSNMKLEELNLTGTMMDSQEKLDAIFNPMKAAALDNDNNKLALHTLLTHNISMKQGWQQYMSPRPKNYKMLEDLPVEQDENFHTGHIEGVPDSFGGLVSIVNKAIYNSTNFLIPTSRWTTSQDVRFGEFHMDISVGLLKPLSDYFVQNPQLDGYLPVDTKTCDELCTMFKYRTENGDSYPQLIFFTPEACAFYATKQSKIRTLNFIPTQLDNSEPINYKQIFEIWLLVRSPKTSLDAIYFDYEADDDLFDLMISQGFNEYDVLSLLRLFPPTRLRFENQMTLPALKGLYSIMWDNYQFEYSNVIYDRDIFLNVGIGYALRETLYQSNIQNCFLRCFKVIIYNFLKIFISQPDEYVFSDQVKQLNNYLSSQTNFFIGIVFLNILYYVVCLTATGLWQKLYVGDSDHSNICKFGPTAYGLYTYGGFAVFSFLMEAYLFANVVKQIPDHTTNKRKFEEEKSPAINQVQPQNEKSILLDEEKQQLNNSNLGSIQSQKQKPKLIPQKSIQEKVMDNKWIKCLLVYKDLFLGQLAKMKLYNDVVFIIQTYYCESYIVCYIALGITGINVLIQLYELLKFIFKQCFTSSSKAKLMNTKFINDFFQVSIIGRNIALSTLLDSVAPFNVTIIPNNPIFRYLMPQYVGRSMSNNVKQYFLKFLFEDVPQILLQIFYVISTAIRFPEQMTYTLYITVANSAFSLLLSFIKFMSIRPTIISQQHFDKLSDDRQLSQAQKDLQYLEMQHELMLALSKQSGTHQNDQKYQEEDEGLLLKF